MDDIQKLLKGVGEITAALMGKEKPAQERIIYDEIVSSHELYKILFEMLEQGAVCKAEDLLFKELEKDFTETKYMVGAEFYQALAALPEERLTAYDFSKEEIAQGLRDLLRLKDCLDLTK